MAAAGGVEAVVAALKTHERSSSSALAALAALRSMCVSDADNLRRAVGAGAAAAVLGALRTHGADVARQGCLTLECLTENADGLEALRLCEDAAGATRAAAARGGNGENEI